ncbi:hypothetical protein BDV25DRAFT_154287 [Aspergillus avenaceus]|uniref:Zn(2)-C6 fungal-type domain-containing protein n=1 Tax=Aspergillus avenaceus TaxID=36643 RepID=A0A5N6TVR5_ASPAV|nr:hypothetical protein BDV25DRAFT_154287 [Aspergillus avenaceus]
MPLARRSHRKARTGCLICKRRRIKCDEHKPSCRNCIQHRIDCAYAESQETTPGVHRTSQQPSPPSCSSIGNNRGTTPASQGPSNSSLPPATVLSDSDVLNARLIHHFTTSTYRTLSLKPETQALWQMDIPEIAFEHKFLLQMILAVSALHLYRKGSPDARYITYAHQQYETSLKSTSFALLQISPLTCHALYAVSTLAFIFELGTSYSRESLLYSGDGTLAHWVLHLRGTRTIISSAWGELSSGVLKPLFNCEPVMDDPLHIGPPLEDLRKHIESDSIAEKTTEACLRAIGELLRWSKMAHVGFFGFMCESDDEFAALLARKDSYALAIFSYSCVLLQHGEPRYWINRWPETMVCEVNVYLDPSLKVHLKWPMEQLGLIYEAQVH